MPIRILAAKLHTWKHLLTDLHFDGWVWNADSLDGVGHLEPDGVAQCTADD